MVGPGWSGTGAWTSYALIGPKGASYEDGWCYGPSRYLGDAVDDAKARALIHTDIRQHVERNGLPLFYLSDHGNAHRARAVTLRLKHERTAQARRGAHGRRPLSL